MSSEPVFSEGRYIGNDIENRYKPFTSQHMPYWWHFREVLCAKLDKNDHNWKKANDTALTDEDVAILIILSYAHYYVGLGIIDALTFHEEIHLTTLQLRSASDSERLQIEYQAARNWRAIHSSLGRTYQALLNVIGIVFDDNPFDQKRLKKHSKGAYIFCDYKPSEIKDNMAKHLVNVVLKTAKKDFLETRNHFDHYFGMRHYVVPGRILIPQQSIKGIVLIEHDQRDFVVDALEIALKASIGLAASYNLIYKELSLEGKALDSFMRRFQYEVVYSDWAAHGGERPKP